MERPPARRRPTVATLGTLLLAGTLAACGDDASVTTLERGDDGAEVVVAAGDEVVIALSEQPGVGDAWQVRAISPGDVLVELDPRSRDGDDLDGGAHVRELVLEAAEPGTATVAVRNCYRAAVDCDVAAEDERHATELTFTVTVE